MKLVIIFLYLFTTFLNSNSSEIQDDKFKKIEIAALEFILSNESLRLYKDMSDSEKEAWGKRFWRTLDPTPMTEINEYYEEFKSRLQFVYDNYHSMTGPYFFDDRGKYYLRFGQPDDHVESVGIGKFYKDNITWAYYDFNLFIDFVEFSGFGYREVQDLSEAVSGAPSNEKVRVAKELYLERADISQKYFRFRNVNNDMDFYGEIQEFNQEKRLALEQTPPARYSFEHKMDPLTVRLASSVFLENNTLPRLELYYSLPLRELSYKSKDSEFNLTHLKKSIIIYDSQYQPFLKREEEIPLYARIGDDLQNSSYVNQHNETLPSGIYFLAMELENPESGRKAILKSQLKIKEFPKNKLSISDIQYANRIQINPNGKNLKANNIQVVPYISSVFFKNRPIIIYFEIYNLQLDEDGKSRFHVDYAIKQSTLKGNLITETAAKITSFFRKENQQSTTGTSFESSGNTSFEQIYSSLDFSSSESGNKEFVVTITDKISGETTNQVCNFILK